MVDLAIKLPRTKFGDIIIRERKGRYYVYKLENVNGDVKEAYVGSLADVVKAYEKIKLGGAGVSDPHIRTRRDLNPGPVAPQVEKKGV